MNTVESRSVASTLSPSLASLTETVLEGVADRLIGDPDCCEFPDILSFEQWTDELTRALARELMAKFLLVRSLQAKETSMKCAGCGKAMERHRQSSWSRQTLWGETRVEDDGYLYCRDCKVSSRPLHGYLGTDRETWSLLVQEAAVDLATDESCQKAVEKLARHHRGVEMNRATALRLLHHHGAIAREFVSEKLQRALGKAASKSARCGEAVELEVEYDGGMIPVATLHPIPVEEGQPVETTPVHGLPKRQKKCRWEEVKVGLVQVPGEVSRLYSVRPTKELDEAFEDLLALACLKDWTESTEVRGIADGARHIRTRMEETFHACPFRFILDRPHAKEHLSTASELLAKESLIEGSAEQWYTQAIGRLDIGEVEQVVEELRKAFERTKNEDILREANYFERNKDAVSYAEYRENGWSSASSEVESSHRHVVQVRLKIPGAWWHPDNVQNILALRMLKANGWWDEYWKTQREQWRQRAKRFAAKRYPPDPIRPPPGK